MTRFNTQLVHGLPVGDNNTGAVNPPIYNSTTYAFERVDAMPRYDYARSGNPTRDFLEQQIAQLEQGTRGFAFASGLAAIHAVCQKREIPLFVDGARLAYALAADECDITLPELAQLCDVFYIGGTKCGALCGEAVVFCGVHAPAHPIPRIKQHGALLAKGRLTGVQFEALFTDGLYFEIGRQAIETARALRRVLHEHGYRFFLETPTNQQFVILPNEDMARIREHAAIEYWEKYDDTHTVVRFCTSWATTQEDIDALAAVL